MFKKFVYPFFNFSFAFSAGLRIWIIIYMFSLHSILIAQPFLEKQSVSAYDSFTNEGFGYSVISKDGLMAVGSTRMNTDAYGGNVVPFAGAVYTYWLSTDTMWEFNQKIVSPDRFNNELFGGSLGMTDSLLIIGAEGSVLDENQSNFLLEAGAVYVYKLDSANSWNFMQKLTPGSRHEDDRFGNNVGITNEVIVGSSLSHSYDSNNVFQKNAGSVFVFEKNSIGDFIETQHVTPSDRDSADRFGWGLYLKNSTELFVGAPFQKGVNYYEGAVYYFVRNSNGIWVEKQKITATNRIKGSFGQSISAWGDYLFIGAPEEELDILGQNPKLGAGAAYIFKKDHMGNYNQIQRIVAPFREHNANFGFDISGFGDVIVIGSPNSSTNSNNQDSITRAGAVYVFDMVNNQWNYSQKIVRNQRFNHDRFGSSVLVGKNYFIAGTHAITMFGTCTFFTRKDSTVGFTEVNKNVIQDMEIFPNPTSSNFTLNTTGKHLNRLLVYDVNGRKVHEENLKGMARAEIQLPNNILNGLYLVRIESIEGVVNKKLLVNGR